MITSNSTDIVNSESNSQNTPGVENPSAANPTPPPNLKQNKKLILALGAILLLTIAGSVYFILPYIKKPRVITPPNQPPSIFQSLQKFQSEEEFKKYLEASTEAVEEFGTLGMLGAPTITELAPQNIPGPAFGNAADKALTPGRVSETNVQVKGIDEPDILKTNGQKIFYSRQGYGGIRPLPVDLPISRGVNIYPPETSGDTKILDAFPPQNLKEADSLTETGDLLLSQEILMIFGNEKIVAYNIAEPTVQKLWTMEIKDNNQIITSRLMNNTVYVVTATNVNSYSPCVLPVFGGSREISISCTDIYQPGYAAGVNATYTVFKIDPQTGEVKEKTSFLGNSGNSLVYMSTSAVYITSTVSDGYLKIFTDFFSSDGQGLFPETVTQRLQKVNELDISSEAKMTEVTKLIQEYLSSLTQDEQMRLNNEMQNKLKDYVQKRSRDLIQTAVTKIDINTFQATTSPLIPGTPHNQFSLDEYQGNLRLATTVGGSLFGSTTANDVYVLDPGLNIIGSVKDLGLTERIYSVRFIEDKGYVVTFRQIDPFYVLDLSDPKNPKLAGELKIPGYSGYLHPINKDKIIGVGMEGNNVKLSLFDVQNPQNPLEVAKYDLDDYFSEAINNHHAFLLDSEKQIFFMPGAQGGYIFDYSNDTFSLKRAVADIAAQRALYIDKYLYIAGQDRIIVLNLDNFEEVNRLSF